MFEPFIKVFASLGMVFYMWVILNVIPFTRRLLKKLNRKASAIAISLIGSFYFNAIYSELNEGMMVALLFLGAFFIIANYYNKM